MKELCIRFGYKYRVEYAMIPGFNYYVGIDHGNHWGKFIGKYE